MPIHTLRVRAGTARPFIGGKQMNMQSVRMESSAQRNSQPEEFHWAATMHDHQTVEVHLGRGSIQVLPSRDDMSLCKLAQKIPVRAKFRQSLLQVE
jgi:hypothetical protein